ncbi:MAG: TRAP transporter fused permease subunit [Deltaproteobacteria bacterium]|nr:TRAP transporter fused permease subunit [Deltaproteobacteria bacterium]
MISEKTRSVSVTRYRTLSGPLRGIFILFAVSGVLITIYQLFHFDFMGVLVGDGYYYLLIALFLPLLFMIAPMSRKALRKPVPWYDLLLALLAFIAPFYFFLNSYRIVQEGWEIIPPTRIYLLGLVLMIVILEAARRAGGMTFALICLVFATYGLYAEHMPGFLEGYSSNLSRLVGFFSMGTEGVTGLPMKVVGNILIGYMVFAVALQATGGGKFFLDLASSLFGGMRGGPAKMSIAASALFGSISGSSISNVLTTGAITIPTMKRTGYPPHFAGAIEAAASTGGVLMPPIMGVTAFVIAEFLAMPYHVICIAAVIPSLCYFGSLYFQVDAFAAKVGLKGLPREEIPPMKKTLIQGWTHMLGMLFLVWSLLFWHWEIHAPFWASLILLVTCNFRKETRLNGGKFLVFLESVGKVLAELVALLCAIGMIIGSLSLTGVAHSFSTEIISLAKGNVVLLLVLGAVTSFILGMGMTITACYVFLALILAPALVKSGFHPLAVHLYIMYWGMASYITPPVALSAFAAAGLAGADPMRTGFKAMQLGFVKYFVPFFFVINPAIILQGPMQEVLPSVTLIFVAVIAMSYSLEGYMPKVGKLPPWLRGSLFVCGICLGLPWPKVRMLGFLLLAVSLVCLMFIWRGKKKEALLSQNQAG